MTFRVMMPMSGGFGEKSTAVMLVDENRCSVTSQLHANKKTINARGEAREKGSGKTTRERERNARWR
jgi:hypothetical protein